MSDDALFVSVIIPAFNAGEFLPAAIDSVVVQRHPRLETLVIDDGSTDNTREVLAEHGDCVRCLSQTNLGPAAARNLGLREARGEVIAFLDADDLWPAGMLRRQVGRLVDDPSLQIAQGFIQEFRGEQEPIGDPYASVNLPSAVFRAGVFESVGPFDESFRINEDTDWFLRAWERGVPKRIFGEVSLFYRKHDRNSTRGVDARREGFAALFKKHLDRRRTLAVSAPLSTCSVAAYFGWDETAPKGRDLR